MAAFTPSPALRIPLTVLALTAAGCEDSGDEPRPIGPDGFTLPCSPITLDAAACDPEQVEFTLESTNPYYPLIVGDRVVLEGEDEGVVVRVEREVLEETRTVAGVEVHVLEHKEYEDGDLLEVAMNFYVETTDGTVCYFGEDVEFYEGGELQNMAGSWRAGVDGARPGIIMPADPQVGDVYYQEVAAGIAEDMGRVAELGTSVAYAEQTFDDVLVIMDSNPIDDEDVCEEERKEYAPGIGEIQDAGLVLIEYTPAGM